MFTSKLLSNAPRITTRRALLVLDLQNDFVRPQGNLFVKNVPEFLPLIPDLAAIFRDSGDEVIWVQTAFEQRRPLTHTDPTAGGGGGGGGEEIIVVDYSSPDSSSSTSASSSSSSSLPAALLSPSAETSRVVHGAQPQPGVIVPKSPRRTSTRRKRNITTPSPSTARNPYSTEDLDAFLTVSERTCAANRCCLPNSTGFHFPAPILSAIDGTRDTVLVKSDYSAFHSASLVFSLRSRFITEVYICGSLSNISVHATALDAARHGLSITLIEDCLGYRSFAKHKEAMRRMADIMGANGVTSGEIMQGQDGSIIPVGSPTTDAAARSITASSTTGVEDTIHRLGVTPPPSPLPSSTTYISGNGGLSYSSRTPKPTRDDTQDEERHRRIPSQSREKLIRKQKLSHPITLVPGDGIGTGDSKIIYDLNLPSDIFQTLRSEVNWQKMYHLSGAVPRLVAVQGAVQPDGSIPIYRHPADESPALYPFTTAVDQIRFVVETLLGHPLNHVLIQLYRDGEDKISEHSDKTLDIVRGSNICNVSLGAQRAMTLRTKADAKGDSGRQSQRVPMPHNSLFILGEETNRKWLHGIRQDKRPENTKSPEERAFNGERISLTFRHIGTFMNPETNTIWGQGALSKSEAGAREIIHGESSETERMIRAFGRENQQSDFNWDEHYGQGFDVVNFVTTSTAKFVVPTGSDEMRSELQIRLALTENGIRYDVVDITELPSGNPSHDAIVREFHEKRRPLLLCPDGSTLLVGELNILSHIGQHLPGQDVPNSEITVNGLDLRGRLNAANQLAIDWRNFVQKTQQAPDAVLSGLSTFDSLVQGKPYITGKLFGVDDCAFWAVLRDIVLFSELVIPDKFPSLMRYYSKVGERSCVRQALGEIAS
ncbi:hypothetical protein FQN57_001571 [Myotisia sp. PD_48]|nr:hypothetical protein FQN57_001571 [Myotisia sp. PD_48]